MIECAKVVHSVTSHCKLWFAQTEIGKTMDERELGNTVGNAVLNACYYSTKYNLEQNTMEYLETVVPAVTDFIKNGNIEQKKEEPIAVSVQETATETFDSNQDFGDLDSPQDPFDFDESIPFAPIGIYLVTGVQTCALPISQSRYVGLQKQILVKQWMNVN